MTRTFFCIALLLASSKVAARDVEVHVFDRSPPTQFQLIEPGRDADTIVIGELPARPSLEHPLRQPETMASKASTMQLRLAISVPAWMRGGRRTPAAVLPDKLAAFEPANCSYTPYRPYVGLSPSGEARRQLYHRDMVEAACAAGIPVALFDSLIVQESRYNPRAVSPAGAIGIAQLMPATARGLRVANAWDVRENLAGGARYLRQQLDEFGRWHLALGAYNAGPGNVRRYGGVPPFQETARYIRSILAGTRINLAAAERSNITGRRRVAYIAYPRS